MGNSHSKADGTSSQRGGSRTARFFQDEGIAISKDPASGEAAVISLAITEHVELQPDVPPCYSHVHSSSQQPRTLPIWLSDLLPWKKRTAAPQNTPNLSSEFDSVTPNDASSRDVVRPTTVSSRYTPPNRLSTSTPLTANCTSLLRDVQTSPVGSRSTLELSSASFPMAPTRPFSYSRAVCPASPIISTRTSGFSSTYNSTPLSYTAPSRRGFGSSIASPGAPAFSTTNTSITSGLHSCSRPSSPGSSVSSREDLDRALAVRLQLEEVVAAEALDVPQTTINTNPVRPRTLSISSVPNHYGGAQPSEHQRLNTLSNEHLSREQDGQTPPQHNWQWDNEEDEQLAMTLQRAEYESAAHGLLLQEASQRGDHDYALALNMQQEGQELQAVARNCVVCGDDTPISELPALLDCNREPRTCSKCYQNWISSEFDSKGWKRIACPEPGCSVLLQHVELQAYATSEDFQK